MEIDNGALIYNLAGAGNSFTIQDDGVPVFHVFDNGNVGIGTDTPDTSLEVNGFTMLGSDAPKIKTKKLTGTTGSTEGSIKNITHGIADPSKIIGMQVLIAGDSSLIVPTGFIVGDEYEYNYYIQAGNVRIFLSSTNSGSILNAPITVLLTYEE